MATGIVARVSGGTQTSAASGPDLTDWVLNEKPFNEPIFAGGLDMGDDGDQDKSVRVESNEEDEPFIATELGTWVDLPSSEVKERESYCLDGSIPGFNINRNTSSHKWVIAFQGGGWCNDEDECMKRTYNPQGKPKQMAIFNYADFKDYNQVIIWYCDGGLFGGDRGPVSWMDPRKGHNITMYFSGKRIVDHVFDHLKANFKFKSASEVLLAGGSAGGLAIFRMADYIGTLMPKSVERYRALPQSGWWASVGGVKEESEHEQYSAHHAGNKEMQTAFYTHDMSSSLSETCVKDFKVDERWKCIYADVGYQHTKTPLFVVQVLDMFVAVQNQTKEDSAKHDSFCVSKSLAKWACTDKSIQRLNSHYSGIVHWLQSTGKYHAMNNGGFFSTCNFHTFYGYEEFWHYTGADGTTIADAVLNWWKSSPGAKSQWYLPCELSEKDPYQCESSCGFMGSGFQYSTPPPHP